MFKKSQKQQQDGEFERPKVYVTGSGRRWYIKADELFRSKRVRDTIEKMAKLDIGKDSSTNSRNDH